MDASLDLKRQDGVSFPCHNAGMVSAAKTRNARREANSGLCSMARLLEIGNQR